MKPSGHISDSIFNEWETGVTRLSQEKVTHADKITIINAVRTYAELKHFMAARDRAMPPEELDLRSFLDTGTGGPVRALNALRWLSRQGQLGWPLEGIQSAPTAGTRKQQRGPGSGYRTAYVEFPGGCHRGPHQAE